MSSDVYVDIWGQIKPDMVDEFNKTIKQEFPDDIYENQNWMPLADKDGTLFLTEHECGHNYRASWNKFVKIAQPFLEKDQEIEARFNDEDDNCWRVLITTTDIIWQKGRIRYQGSYENFMEDYEKSLPVEVKEQLEVWWAARQL